VLVGYYQGHVCSSRSFWSFALKAVFSGFGLFCYCLL
jgi:hypothetical protein